MQLFKKSGTNCYDSWILFQSQNPMDFIDYSFVNI